MSQRRGWGLIAGLLVLLFILIWSPHLASNPPVNRIQTLETVLNPPSSVKETLAKSCNNCHSDRTEWPWYAHLRPIASRVRNDVRAGRRVVNFSQWATQTRGDAEVQKKTLETSCALMQAGMMPPPYYLYIHRSAKLTNMEIREFCAWAHSVQPSSAP
jgi:Haem-binding domain